MKKEITKSIVIYLIIVCMGVSMLFPFYWLVRSSLMTGGEIFRLPIQWLPEKLQFDNYKNALERIQFLRCFKNTIIVVIFNVIGALISNSLAAFGFARINFKGRNVWFAILLSTMMLPWAVTLIPQFIGWKYIGAYNTFYPLIVGSFFGNAFYTFLLRQFYLTIPFEYDEAARIDGANYLKIWWEIIIPLSKPALTTIAIFTFMGTWNDFLGPLIYLADESKWTLSLALQIFIGQFSQEWHLLMAASTVAILPMIITFFLCERAFIEGITITGLKA